MEFIRYSLVVPITGFGIDPIYMHDFEKLAHGSKLNEFCRPPLLEVNKSVKIGL